MVNLVKYGSYEIDEAAKEKEEIDASGGGADFWKWKVGRNVARFLPPAIGKRSPFRVVYQHFITVPGATNPMSFVCPRLEAKKFCPACKKAEDLRATGNPADADLAQELYARRRVFANAINRDEPEKGPRIVAFGKTVHEQLVALRTDEDAGGDYTHPEEGFDIIIERQGSGKNDTKYAVRPARNTSPLSPDAAQMQEWIDMQRNLDTFARIPSEEDLRKMMTGDTSEGAPRSAANSRPRPSGGTRAPAQPAPATSRRRTAQDDIEAEGEEVEE